LFVIEEPVGWPISQQRHRADTPGAWLALVGFPHLDSASGHADGVGELFLAHRDATSCLADPGAHHPLALLPVFTYHCSCSVLRTIDEGSTNVKYANSGYVDKRTHFAETLRTNG